MNLTICGINIPGEHLWLEKTTAKRIHNIANSNTRITDLGLPLVAGRTKAIVEGFQGILEAINTRKPRDITNKIIDKQVVLQEIVVLAADAKIFCFDLTKLNVGVVDRVLQHDNETFSISQKCSEITAIAQEIVGKSFFFDDSAFEVFKLLFLSTSTKDSSMASLPKELLHLFFQNYMKLQIEDINTQADSMAALKRAGSIAMIRQES